jgi:hypothetical protein
MEIFNMPLDNIQLDILASSCHNCGQQMLVSSDGLCKQCQKEVERCQRYLLGVVNDLTLCGCKLIKDNKNSADLKLPHLRRFEHTENEFRISVIPVRYVPDQRVNGNDYILSSNMSLIASVVCRPEFVNELHIAAFSVYGQSWFAEELMLGCDRKYVHCTNCGRNALYPEISTPCYKCGAERNELPF